MKSNEKAEVYELLKNLADLYSGSTAERKISAYADYLEDLPFALVKSAIRKAPGRFKFFPSAGELRGMCDTGAGAGGVPGWQETKRRMDELHGCPSRDEAVAMAADVFFGGQIPEGSVSYGFTPKEQAKEKIREIVKQLGFKFGGA